MLKYLTLMNHIKLIFFVVIGLGLSCAEPSQEVKEPSRPNILFLFADDMAYNAMGAMGNTLVKTPHLDELASRGFMFTHAFNQGSWSGAVCVVSRAMLNSGRFVYHARNDINEVPLWGEVLGQNGYQTFMTGKWHNGDHTVLKSFQQAKSIGKGMFETLGGPSGTGYKRPTPTNDTWSAADTSLLGHWTPEVKDIVYSDSGKSIGTPYIAHKHTSTLYADHAIDFLSTWKESEEAEPFFMYVAFNAPHDPRQAPQSYLDMYPVEEIPLPPNYLPEHPFDQGERYTLRDEILAPFPRSEAAVRRHLQEYYAIISHMDAEIGRVLAALEASGALENTYVIFTADHGLAVGSHGLLGKQNAYDHSIRVPLIFSGPGIPQSKTSDEMVYLQSVHPTTFELASLSIPSHIEFESLYSHFSQDGATGESEIFGSYKDFQRMLRTERYKYILYPEVQKTQLFDLIEDPNELNNLAENPDSKELIEKMHQSLIRLQEKVGDPLDITGVQSK